MAFKIKLQRETQRKIKSLFSFGSKATDIYFTVRGLRHKPTKADWVAAAWKVGDVFSNFVEFEQEEQECISNILLDAFLEKHQIEDYDDYGCGSDIQGLLIEYITKFYNPILLNSKRDKDVDDGTVVDNFNCYEAMVEDVPVFWYVDPNDKEVTGPWIEDDKYDTLLTIIGTKVWASMGSTRVAAVRKGDEFTIISDDLAKETLPSELATNYAERINKFITFDGVGGPINRALLFYGSPGTGKSTILRKIAEILELKTLRISFDDISSDISALLMPMIKVLKPDVLIMDDVDRSSRNSSLIALIEQFKQHVKVILASANHTQLMDQAVLRPGRFDEAVPVELLDMAVINALVGEGVINEHKKILQELPIVYIDEFNKIRRVLGDDEAMKAVYTLQSRKSNLGSKPVDSMSPMDILKELQGQMKGNSYDNCD